MTRAELIDEIKRLQDGPHQSRPGPRTRVYPRARASDHAERELSRVQTEALIESQRLLEESRDRYFELFDSAPIGYIKLNSGGMIAAINGAGLRLLGAGHEVLRMPLRRFVREEDRRLVSEHLRRCDQATRDLERGALDGPQQVSTEVMLQNPEGTLTPVQLISSIEPGEERGNAEPMYRTAMMDMTQIRAAEEALRASEARLRLALEAGQAGTWELDPRSGRFSWSSGGLPRPDVQPGADGATYPEWLSLVDPKDRPEAEAEFRDVLEQRKPELRFEFRARLPGRGGPGMADVDPLHWFLCIGRPWHDEQGRVTHLRGIYLDVTDRRRAQEELARHRDHLEDIVRERTRELEETHAKLRLSERMASLGTLSAGLGHDMGNLLLPLRVRLDSLERRVLDRGPDPESADDIRTIRRCVDYLQRLASGLRMFALDPAAPGGPDQRTDLAEWWHDAEPFLKNSVPRGVALEFRLAPGTPAAAITRQGLTQAVFNLVQNAGDAMKARGYGHVTVWAEPGQEDGAPTVRVGVTDDGPGMSPEVRQRCMEPFFTTKARQLSTGLGLALVHGIVQRAHGSVAIDTTPGIGTTFVVSLPAHAPRADTSAAPRPAATVRVKDRRLRGLVAAMLESMDFELIEPPASLPSLGVVLTDDPAEPRGEGEPPPVVVLLGGASGGTCAANGSPRRRTLDLGRSPRAEELRRVLEEVKRTLAEGEARA